VAGAPPRCIEWAVAARPLPGEIRSGDLHLVHELPGESLIAVIDGLGHGPAAEEAAARARAVLIEHAAESVEELFQRCDQALIATRGAAMTLAKIRASDGAMRWSAVGNVEAVVFRAAIGSAAREHILQRGGVVGYRMPRPRASTIMLAPGDLLVLATDGIADRFGGSVGRGAPVDDTAARVLERHARATDDALVLVVRYLGPRPV
jgi:phosphoserine phosphatase RsbX